MGVIDEATREMLWPGPRRDVALWLTAHKDETTTWVCDNFWNETYPDWERKEERAK